MARVARLWWIFLVLGCAWFVVAFVVLQFDDASVKTVGTITGLMFIGSGLQHLALAALGDSLRWFWGIFGVLLVAAGVVALANPEDTFAGIADILGFLFLIVALSWITGALVQRGQNDLWWVGLVNGIIMLALAFWTSGQFFIEKAYVLLVFAGIWALLHGLGDVIRAFQVRKLRI